MALHIGQRHRYKECGLDNVYLVNIQTLKCKDCGVTEIVIPRLKLLHATLARAIALSPNVLSGTEIRFLRKQLKLKAKEFAVFLHVDASTLSRWENGDQEPGSQSDSLVRYVFFRLFEEREGHKQEGRVAEQIASTGFARERHEICINVDNPSVYSYC